MSGLLSFLSALSTRSRGISAAEVLSHDTGPNFMRLNDGAPFLSITTLTKFWVWSSGPTLDEDKSVLRKNPLFAL